MQRGKAYFWFTKYGARKIGGTPCAFHLYLSIFHFGRIKEKPWEKNEKKWPATSPSFTPKGKTKRTLNGGHLVAIWDVHLESWVESVEWAYWCSGC